MRMSNSSCRFGERIGEMEFLSLDNDDSRFASNHREAAGEIASALDTDGGGCPFEVWLFALGYLNVKDLLSVERVSKLLRSTVHDDAFLWRDIHIDHPLSERITDDALLQLANRAQGTLRTLSLDNCSRITDNGLERVLKSNPRLIKLNIPGCIGLTSKGIVKSLKSASIPGIMQLRLGVRYDVTKRHFEELISLLGADDHKEKSNVHKPRFYGQYSFPCDDDCALDIEVCPTCKMLRMVYDCSAESCQGKKMESQLCRACLFCIQRCYQCGRCVNNISEEIFYFEQLCSDCWKL